MKLTHLVYSTAIAALTCSALADTIAWYRFETTDAIGTDIAVGTRLTNSVSATVYPLEVQNFGRNGRWNKTKTTQVGQTSWVPKAGNAPGRVFPDGDSSFTVANLRGLSLRQGRNDGAESSGTVLRMIENGVPFVPQTFTIEFFWKSNGFNFQSGNQYKSFISRPAATGYDAGENYEKGTFKYGFEFGINGAQALKLRYSTASQANYEKSFGVNIVNDGNWHHYAVTVNQVTREANLYCDYELVGNTLSLEGDIYYGSSADLVDPDIRKWTFGGNYYGYCMPVTMDEIRISDAVLEPSQFLGYIDPVAKTQVAEGNTIIYVPFDEDVISLTGAKIASLVGPNQNPEPTASFASASEARFGSGVFSFTNEVCSLSMRQAGDVDRQKNGGSLHVKIGNTAVNTEAGFPLDNFNLDGLEYKKYTIEFFYRVTTDANWSEPIRIWNNDAATKNYRPLMIQLNASHQPAFTIGCIDTHNTGSYTYTTSVKDSKWHHYAVTIDNSTAGSTSYAIYIDYDEKKTGTITGNWTVGSGSAILLGGRANLTGHECDYDELRITHGVLSPDKFLHDCRALDGETIVYLPLDSDLRSVASTWGNPDGTAAVDVNTAAALNDGTLLYFSDPFFAVVDHTLDVERDWNYKSLMYDGTGSVNIGLDASGFLLHDFAYDKLTIEFFYKPYDLSGSWPEVIRLKRANQNFQEIMLQFAGTGTTSPLRFTVAGTQIGDTTGLTGGDLMDGKWHHIAITLDRTIEAGYTTSELFIDGTSKLRAKRNLDFIPDKNIELYFGSRANCKCKAAYDEFRIVHGILTPEQFLKRGTHKVRTMLFMY